MTIRRCAFALAMTMVVSAASGSAQPPFNDSQVITGFNRAVDAYAFQHRQVERRSGATSDDQQRMAAALRATRPTVAEGAIFTPLVAAAFRARIAVVSRTGCSAPGPGDSFVVPRPNQDASGALPIAACLTAVLPRLPTELEYRARGVALVLVDTHANMVVDILHAAFARVTP